MLTGAVRSQIDQIWNTFWTGGISNPLEVIEQITYLLFLRRLDELQAVDEAKAARLGKQVERESFPKVRTGRSARSRISAGRGSSALVAILDEIRRRSAA